jgi:hypothetical protein
MEAHTGRLVQIHMYDNICIECYLEHIFTQEKGITDLSGWGNWSDYAVHESGEYHIHDSKLYKLKEHRNLSDDDCIAERNKEDHIVFTVMFYNGSWTVQEALDSALDDLKKKEEK